MAPPADTRGRSDVSDLDALARRVQSVAQIEGDFTLRSGRRATDYFDKYRFEADPSIVEAVVQAMVPLVPAATEVLAGLELGGIPLVTLLSQYTGLPATFVRKEAKSYGTCRLAEGAEIRSRRVLVVEDVVTSGGQIAISSRELRELGAHIEHALCAIDREEGGTEALAADGIVLLSVFSRGDIFRAATA